jgi:hypothetical protein
VAYANGFDSDSLPRLNRAAKRITITLPHGTFLRLQQRSTAEARSLSNLAAYLIDRGLERSDQF